MFEESDCRSCGKEGGWGRCLADFDSLKIFVLGFFGRRRLHLSQSLAMFRLEVGFESFLAFSSVSMPIISGNATMSNDVKCFIGAIHCK